MRSLGKGLRGKVSRVNFYSCCTGKLLAQGKAGNVIDTLADDISDGGRYHVKVCGLEHQGHVWYRKGKFHFGISKGDSKPCANR